MTVNKSPNSSLNPHLKSQLLAALATTPSEWVLTPVDGNKRPYRDNWQSEEPLSSEAIAQAIEQGETCTHKKKIGFGTYRKHHQPLGFGLRTGPVSGGIMTIDADGEAAQALILELGGSQPLPTTVAFSSGKPGRCQYALKVPQKYWDLIRTRKIKVKGSDGEVQHLEFRWDGCQSVLPPSVHPETGAYHWVEGCKPTECEVAEAPVWVIEQMLVEPSPAASSAPLQLSPTQAPTTAGAREWTEVDFANSYLNALSQSRADDYDSWLTVGMALHSVSDSLLSEWDKWSQQSAKYKPGECEKKWKSFNSNGGVSLGTLGHLAKQDGWLHPFTNGNGHVSHNQFHSQNGTVAVNTQQRGLSSNCTETYAKAVSISA